MMITDGDLTLRESKLVSILGVTCFIPLSDELPYIGLLLLCVGVFSLMLVGRKQNYLNR